MKEFMVKMRIQTDDSVTDDDVVNSLYNDLDILGGDIQELTAEETKPG